jgi:hypothetical protein
VTVGRGDNPLPVPSQGTYLTRFNNWEPIHMSKKKLYHVAIDEPFGDHRSDEHDRDYIFLVWLSKPDLAELMKRTDGKVSYWEAGVCDDLDAFITTWHEFKEADA